MQQWSGSGVERQVRLPHVHVRGSGRTTDHDISMPDVVQATQAAAQANVVEFQHQPRLPGALKTRQSRRHLGHDACHGAVIERRCRLASALPGNPFLTARSKLCQRLACMHAPRVDERDAEAWGSSAGVAQCAPYL